MARAIAALEAADAAIIAATVAASTLLLAEDAEWLVRFLHPGATADQVTVERLERTRRRYR